MELLDRWRRITNLVSEQSFGNVWERHIQDSIHLQRFAQDADRWLDLGSGAGFPGIVIGILIAERDRAQVHCVDSDARKCTFLRTVISDLNIPVKVHNLRAEAISLAITGPVDIITARAFSSLTHILTISSQYLSAGATAILPRGRKSAQDVETLDPRRYIATMKPNPGRHDGVILFVKEKGRKP